MYVPGLGTALGIRTKDKDNPQMFLGGRTAQNPWESTREERDGGGARAYARSERFFKYRAVLMHKQKYQYYSRSSIIG